MKSDQPTNTRERKNPRSQVPVPVPLSTCLLDKAQRKRVRLRHVGSAAGDRPWRWRDWRGISDIAFLEWKAEKLNLKIKLTHPEKKKIEYDGCRSRPTPSAFAPPPPSACCEFPLFLSPGSIIGSLDHWIIGSLGHWPCRFRIILRPMGSIATGSFKNLAAPVSASLL